MAAIITNRVWRHIFKIMSKQLDPIFWQCKSENISHPKKFLVKKKQQHKNKSYSAICILRNIQHVLKKKVESTFAASSVVQLHALVRKHLIANIIYKISCIEALKIFHYIPGKTTFFKRTHGIEFV